MAEPTIARADARANRERLLTAAHDVFRERGMDTEMKDIAERAGVGVGTIYRNFPTKDDLIIALAADVIGGVRAMLDAADRMADPIAAVETVLSGGVATTRRFGGLAMAITGGQAPVACRDMWKNLDPPERLSRIIQRGIDQGVFRADLDAGVAAAMAFSAFAPWTYFMLAATHSPEEIVQAAMSMFLQGARSATQEAGS